MTSKINKLKPANQVNNQAAPSNGKEHFTLSEDEVSQAGDGNRQIIGYSRVQTVYSCTKID